MFPGIFEIFLVSYISVVVWLAGAFHRPWVGGFHFRGSIEPARIHPNSALDRIRPNPETPSKHRTPCHLHLSVCSTVYRCTTAYVEL